MTTRNYRALLVSVGDGIATLTLNRPERRNAINTQLSNELLYALGDAFEDETVRSIVLTGAGKAFCAGGDFLQMSSTDGQEELPPKGDFKDLLTTLFTAPKPIIARVNGVAMGGGLGIVAACTFAVAASDVKLGTPEIDVGLFPFMIMAVLERHVPRRRLLEMMLLGERFDAEEARRLGLVNRVVPAEELDAEVARYTSAIGKKSSSTVRLGLAAVRDADGMPLAEKLPMLSQRLAECLSTDDAREGLMAFLEKREPQWTGR